MKYSWGVFMLFMIGFSKAQEVGNAIRPLFYVDEYDDVGIFGNEILGVAGVDYPTLGEVPITTFSCNTQPLPGYYADPQAYCQVFYICQEGGKSNAFLCPNGTIFNQEFLVCVWWYNFDCGKAVSFYGINAEIARAMGEVDATTAARLTGEIPSSAFTSSRVPALGGTLPGRFSATTSPIGGPLGLRGSSAGPFGIRGPAGATLSNRFGPTASPFGARSPTALASSPQEPAGAPISDQPGIRGPAASPFVGTNPEALLARQRALALSGGRYTSHLAALPGGFPTSGGPRPAIGASGSPLRPFNAVGRPFAPFPGSRQPYTSYTSPIAQRRTSGQGGPAALGFNQPTRFGSLPGVNNYNPSGIRGPSPIRGPAGSQYTGQSGVNLPSGANLPTRPSAGNRVYGSGDTSPNDGYYYNRPSSDNRFPPSSGSLPLPGSNFPPAVNPSGNILLQSGNDYKTPASEGYNYNPAIPTNNVIGPGGRPQVGRLQAGRPGGYRPVTSRPVAAGLRSDTFTPLTNNIRRLTSTTTGQPTSLSQSAGDQGFPLGVGYNYQRPSRPFPPPPINGNFNEPYRGGTPNREYLPPTK